MITVLKKFVAPIALVGTSSSLGAGGYGISNYLNDVSRQSRQDEIYGENSKVFSRYIKKTEESENSFNLLCEKLITSEIGDRKEDFPIPECHKKFQDLVSKNKKLEIWMESDKERFSESFSQYFDNLSEESELLFMNNENYLGNWKYQNLDCNNEQISEKIIVSCSNNSY
ncbi:hypothetical protein [Mycoplasma suis]|uniref:Uncharacterized protein n=1 Tax=Mycoplasma suis (strain KI_3806) TaxID=708248 RepID=F0V305_MYCS3|nr:hypothetical protein [Mycoplasma suis]CBZ40227.1 hypothetical protein MSUIS_01340 [Mycoplasma suis KI3806]